VVFNDPSAPIRILAALAAAVARRRFAWLPEAIGFAHRDTEDQQAFFAARQVEVPA